VRFFLNLKFLVCIFLALLSCSQRTLPIEKQQDPRARFAIEEHSFHYSNDYGGWDFLVSFLSNDGVSKQLLRHVYGSGSIVPTFDFVPFKLNPKESHDMYSGFRTSKISKLVEDCYIRYQPIFNEAARRFEVSPRLLTSILFIESHCGQHVGTNLVVNRLSRVVSVGDPNNLRKNLVTFRQDNPTVQDDDAVQRAQYLFNTFYPQLLALFQEHAKGKLNLFELKGSIAGAFGWTQFLPLTYQKFGVDGDQDGIIRLDNPSDAIFSIARFFNENGWKNTLSRKEKHTVIWQYNRSIPYIDTVLYLMKET
jgi:hypothetical protein